MANIIITERCNLNCSYCFVQELVRNKKQGKKDITIDDFQEIVNFVTKACNHVGLIGGEPTLHPKIREIIEHTIENKILKSVTLFTNATYLERVIDQLGHSKMIMLVNLNSPQDIGKENYKKIIKNLDKLYFERYNENFTLGINMYKENFDYEYIVDALQRYGKKKVRVAIIAPNSEDMRKNNYLEYCRKMKPSILRFFRRLYDLEIIPNFDCSGNVIPLCLYTKKEMSFMKKLAVLVNCSESSCSKEKTNITDFPHCNPIIEFTIDKKVVRCLPLSEFEKIDMKNFRDINEINGYYRNRYDVFMHNLPIDDKCRKCAHMHTMQCQGGCIGYRINEINQARNIVQNIRKVKVRKK